MPQAMLNLGKMYEQVRLVVGVGRKALTAASVSGSCCFACTPSLPSVEPHLRLKRGWWSEGIMKVYSSERGEIRPCSCLCAFATSSVRVTSQVIVGPAI